jgi:cobalt-precorrin 5A hydrolase
MVVGEAMIVAGVGCRQGASAAAIETVIAAALERAGLTPQGLDVLATAAFKGDEPGIATAAAARGVPLILVSQADLEIAAGRATHSRRVAELVGVGSVAEAAALAAAGPAGRLMVARIAIGPATCALASSEVAIPGAAP